MSQQADYFENHARARRFPWSLYHLPLERDLERFLSEVAGQYPTGEVLVVGCGLLQELDRAPEGLRFHVVDIDSRAVEAVLARNDPRIRGGTVVEAETPIELGRTFCAVYAKEVVEHVVDWRPWLQGIGRSLHPGGRLWLSTPNYGDPWLPALEWTVLEAIARRGGFSRRGMHPTRFSRTTLRQALMEVGMQQVEIKTTRNRLALTAWARRPE